MINPQLLLCTCMSKIDDNVYLSNKIPAQYESLCCFTFIWSLISIFAAGHTVLIMALDHNYVNYIFMSAFWLALLSYIVVCDN